MAPRPSSAELPPLDDTEGGDKGAESDGEQKYRKKTTSQKTTRSSLNTAKTHVTVSSMGATGQSMGSAYDGDASKIVASRRVDLLPKLLSQPVGVLLASTEKERARLNSENQKLKGGLEAASERIAQLEVELERERTMRLRIQGLHEKSSMEVKRLKKKLEALSAASPSPSPTHRHRGSHLEIPDDDDVEHHNQQQQNKEEVAPKKSSTALKIERLERRLEMQKLKADKKNNNGESLQQFSADFEEVPKGRKTWAPSPDFSENNKKTMNTASKKTASSKKWKRQLAREQKDREQQELDSEEPTELVSTSSNNNNNNNNIMSPVSIVSVTATMSESDTGNTGAATVSGSMTTQQAGGKQSAEDFESTLMSELDRLRQSETVIPTTVLPGPKVNNKKEGGGADSQATSRVSSRAASPRHGGSEAQSRTAEMETTTTSVGDDCDDCSSLSSSNNDRRRATIFAPTDLPSARSTNSSDLRTRRRASSIKVAPSIPSHLRIRTDGSTPSPELSTASPASLERRRLAHSNTASPRYHHHHHHHSSATPKRNTPMSVPYNPRKELPILRNLIKAKAEEIVVKKRELVELFSKLRKLKNERQAMEDSASRAALEETMKELVNEVTLLRKRLSNLEEETGCLMAQADGMEARIELEGLLPDGKVQLPKRFRFDISAIPDSNVIMSLGKSAPIPSPSAAGGFNNSDAEN